MNNPMFDGVKRCKLPYKMMIRLNNFLYVFNLRQGAIVVAVHQIALSSFILIIFLVGISHISEMLTMLHNDMEDDAERHGFYEVLFGEQITFHEAGVTSTNNQRKFAKAQRLATATIIFLYTSTLLTSLYLMCCISLLHGAIKCKREYVWPWIVAACTGVLLLIGAVIVGNGYPCVVKLFGGHNLYYFGCTLIFLTFIYALCAVISFALELGGGRCSRAIRSDERGERLLLLDHGAHSSLLSAAQLNKLSVGTRSQFV